MPILADGTIVTPRVGALRRIKQYLLVASSRQNARALQDEIDKYTQDTNTHPNAVIYELLVILMSIYKGMGRSPVPTLDKAIAAARGDKYGHDPAAISKIILPN
jgi:hypothetical protein